MAAAPRRTLVTVESVRTLCALLKAHAAARPAQVSRPSGRACGLSRLTRPEPADRLMPDIIGGTAGVALR